MSFAQREAQYAPVLRAAFLAEGLPGAWGCALARQESKFDPKAEALGGGDGIRGGSFGLCQMSLKTAREELGYIGDGEGLKDPWVNAQLAAKYCKILTQRFGSALQDVAAAYNSGRPFAKAPRQTRENYVAHVLSFAKLYEV